METETQLPACSVVHCAVRTVMWCGLSDMFGVLISIFLLYLGLCIREYSHQTLKQWLHQTVKMAASPLSASAAATFREKAGPVQLFSASPRSLPSATFGGDFCCFGVREGGKSLHFRWMSRCRRRGRDIQRAEWHSVRPPLRNLRKAVVGFAQRRHASYYTYRASGRANARTPVRIYACRYGMI